MFRLLVLPPLLWAIGSQHVCAAPITVVDDVGREITIAEPAKRIVSLAPHLTEILFELGVGDRITGTVRYADYPPAAGEIPRLGDAFSVNVEATVAMEPDIVFAWRTGGSSRALARLESLDVPVYYNEAPRLTDIGPSVVNMGRLVGKAARGEELAGAFEARLKELTRPESGTTVFFQISDENLYTVNGDHLIGQSIALCGGTNIFADLSAPVPLVSKEAVVATNPDLIIITRVPGAPPSDWAATWQGFDGLASRVAHLDPNLISRPGLRMQEGIANLCSLIPAD